MVYVFLFNTFVLMKHYLAHTDLYDKMQDMESLKTTIDNYLVALVTINDKLNGNQPLGVFDRVNELKHEKVISEKVVTRLKQRYNRILKSINFYGATI
ncbi:hypothetical protein BPT24_266 [Tenacibaculum phage pT24]|uniref:Uncharacterized protein n=1 Tax=Tenacibaculum phage pT24 TaxID=1880590 RepID=A0A1B4XX50_9CAUD|nr:hypothetical protein HYP10_gp262 [Tenacibaculum phage pT24]BAV39384.1 hypothetical protein BPT24_266 [Tenacibaculum phage pT24]